MSRYPRTYTNTVDFTTSDDLIVGDDATVTDDLSAVDASFTTLAVSGATTLATATASVGVQVTAVARTATADGLTTGIIADGTSFVTVTSADANNIITLPTSTPGAEVTLRNGATGYELRSSSPTTIAINGGTGSAAESAVAANSLVHCVCGTATTWVCTNYSTAGVVAATEVAAP